MATKKFPLGKCRALAAKVKDLHEELQSILADCPAAPSPAAQDLSDRDAAYNQGQDSARVKTMDQAFANFGRLGAGGACVSADAILNRK